MDSSLFEGLLKELVAGSSKDIDAVVPVSHPLVAELLASVAAE